MSTCSAKIRELDEKIQRQRLNDEQKEAKQSERVSHLERQIRRISDLDAKLDDVQTDFGRRLILFENRMVDTVNGHIKTSITAMGNMNSNLNKLMAVVGALMMNWENQVDQPA